MYVPPAKAAADPQLNKIIPSTTAQHIAFFTGLPSVLYSAGASTTRMMTDTLNRRIVTRFSFNRNIDFSSFLPGLTKIEEKCFAFPRLFLSAFS